MYRSTNQFQYVGSYLTKPNKTFYGGNGPYRPLDQFSVKKTFFKNEGEGAGAPSGVILQGSGEKKGFCKNRADGGGGGGGGVNFIYAENAECTCSFPLAMNSIFHFYLSIVLIWSVSDWIRILPLKKDPDPLGIIDDN